MLGAMPVTALLLCSMPVTALTLRSQISLLRSLPKMPWISRVELVLRNKKGQRCRRDTAGKLYPIYKHGQKIRKGDTSRPDEVSSHVWWDVYTFNDRAKWWQEFKA
eukprot:6017163-Heterocapsa_arctica.AAC.1